MDKKAVTTHRAGAWTFKQRLLRGAILFAGLSLMVTGTASLSYLLILFGLLIVALSQLPSSVTVDQDAIVLRWLLLRTRIPFAAMDEVTLRTVSMRGRFGSMGSRYRLEIDCSDAPSVTIERAPQRLYEAISAARRARLPR